MVPDCHCLVYRQTLVHLHVCCRSGGLGFQHHLQRRPDWCFRPHICEEHPPAWSRHPGRPSEGRRPAARGEKTWTLQRVTSDITRPSLPLPVHSFLSIQLFSCLSYIRNPANILRVIQRVQRLLAFRRISPLSPFCVVYRRQDVHCFPLSPVRSTFLFSLGE